MEPTLYVKHGSRLTSGMAECFYDRVLVDPELAHFSKASIWMCFANIWQTS